MAIEQALYTATATATGGRTGTARSSDGELQVSLATPKQLGGAGGAGTNPEQLFAAGYAACFIGAMKAVAAKQKLKLPDDVSIDSSVGIGAHKGKPGAFGIEVAMTIKLPGMERAAAEQLVATAHEVCPYSKLSVACRRVARACLDGHALPHAGELKLRRGLRSGRRRPPARRPPATPAAAPRAPARATVAPAPPARDRHRAPGRHRNG